MASDRLGGIAQALVAVHTPEGREFLWLGPDSDIVQWEVGQFVLFRKRSLVVRERTDNEGSLTLKLDLPD
jgi:hypothetical protein